MSTSSNQKLLKLLYQALLMLLQRKARGVCLVLVQVVDLVPAVAGA
jgi:hypothetical protein